MKSITEYINEQLSEKPNITEAGMSINRLLTKHADAGYIIISACRHENSPEENNKVTSDLRRDIKDAGFTFKTVLGGFVEDADTNPHDVTEKSFVVFCYNRSGEKLDFGKLKSFGIEICKKYNQDSVLVTEPDGTPAYFDKTGNEEMRFSDKVTINRAVEMYFTKLGNTKFTFKESKLDGWNSVMDRTCRHSMGEIF